MKGFRYVLTNPSLSIAASVLLEGGEVVWVEASQPFPVRRLREMLQQRHGCSAADVNEMLQRTRIVSAVYLTTLLAFAQASGHSVCRNAKLVIVDDVSQLVWSSVPTTGNDRNTFKTERRVVTALLNAFTRLAARNDLVVVIVNKMKTSVQYGAINLVDAFGAYAGDYVACMILLHYTELQEDERVVMPPGPCAGRVRVAAVQRPVPVSSERVGCDDTQLRRSGRLFGVDGTGLSPLVCQQTRKRGTEPLLDGLEGKRMRTRTRTTSSRLEELVDFEPGMFDGIEFDSRSEHTADDVRPLTIPDSQDSQHYDALETCQPTNL